MARRALTPSQLSLVQATRPWLTELDGPLVVGVSGGADSMALAAALAHLAPERTTAVVVDHGLQPASAQVAQSVRESVAGLGLACRVEKVQVQPRGEGLEAAAREARLAALAADGHPVLLAHTLDDQAESVLLGLARGSGAASLQGMAARRGPFVRPLLGLRRATTRQACRDWGITVWDDPMNDDPSYLRVRVRKDLLPLLDDVLGPGVHAALARTAELLQRDQELLGQLTEQALARVQRDEGLDVAGLATLHPALQGRVVHHWLAQRVPSPEHGHVRSVLGLVEHWRGQSGVSLPGGHRARRVDGLLVVDDGSAG